MSKSNMRPIEKSGEEAVEEMERSPNDSPPGIMSAVTAVKP